MLFDFPTLFSADTNSKYLLVSFQTWVLYETFITADHSVELFWKQRWNTTKALFLINRYAAIVTVSFHTLHQFVRDASTMFCYVSLWLGFIGTALLISVLHFTMLLRVNALWSSSLFIKSIMTLFASANILAFTIWGSYGWSKAIVRPQLPPFTGCTVVAVANLKLNMIFISSFVFETCVIILTLIKVYPIIRQAPGRLPLVTMLLNDGIAYYLIIMVSQSFAFGVSFSQNIPLLLPVVLSTPAIVVGAIACNRLLIRLQELLEGRKIVDSDMMTGAGIVGMDVDRTTNEKGSDLRLPSTTHGERGIQEPSSVQNSNV